MNKLTLVAILAVVSLQIVQSANVTSGTGCGGTTINITNCAYCDSASAATYCQNCNVGWQLTATTSGGPTLCAYACAAPCIYCKGTTGAATTTAGVQRSAGNADLALCQMENVNPATTLTQAAAYCKPTAATGTTLAVYYTPGAVVVADNTFPCYTCSVAGCVNCKPATGSLATAAQTQCAQCADGYYLDGNTTVTNTAVTPNTNSTVGTSCNACGSISSVSGTTSNSAFIVVGVCNACVNKTGCINATCTRFQGTTAGTGSADTTSYVFDIAKQQCVAKSGSRLAVAFVAAIAVTFVALF